MHDTIGFDLVGMVVDDLVVCGAEPLFMTDYIACGKVVPERIAAIVKGIAEACSQAGCALVGGETAEHPGLLEPRRVRRGRGGHRGGGAGPDPRRRTGSSPATWSIAMRVLRSALQRLLAGPAGLLHHGRLDAGPRRSPELGRTLGEELLEPTRIYSPGLPGADRRRRGARDQPRDRWRAGQQPGPGDARTRAGADRPDHLDTAAGLRPGRRSRPGVQADLEATLNIGVGMVVGAARRCRRRRPAHSSPVAACRPGSAARSPPPTPDTGERVILDGRHPAR